MGRWANKYVIGLTGNIGMGKSVVRKMLEHLGAYTIDVDHLTYQAIAPETPAYLQVIETFGTGIVDNDNRIDRMKLNTIIFTQPEALNRLEALTQPYVEQGIDTLVRRAKQPIIVIEAINLVDSPVGSQVDSIWVVDASPLLQLERLMKIREMSEHEAQKRIDAQNPQRDKLAKATVVITNNDTAESVWEQVQREWTRVLQAYDMAQPSQSAEGPALRASPVQPAAQALPTKPSPAQPVSEPVMTSETLHMNVRRGMPKNADEMAQLLNQTTGTSLTREDVMKSFGEKSYFVVEADGKLLGLAGFEVENLITRLDDLIIAPGAPIQGIAEALIQQVENASKELQSEVGFMYLPPTASPTLIRTLADQGYEQTTLDAIKIPAWREAVTESQPPDTMIMRKRLRTDRVLKPLDDPLSPKTTIELVVNAIPVEDIRFTAVYPKEVAVEAWYTLLVYAHIAAAVEAVRADAALFKDQMGGVPRESQGSGSVKLARGTELTIVPKCDGITFNPERISFRWFEDKHRADFRFRADKVLADTADTGLIEVYVGPLIVSTIKMAMLFNPPEEIHLQTNEATTVQAEIYKPGQIFASYSHADTWIVTACRNAYKALGFEVLLDIDHLRSGQVWNDALKAMIQRADIFQLFWSEHSAQSVYVRQEWEYALECSKEKDKGFIRPMYWETPMTPPPAELETLHFAYMPLQQADS